MAIGVFFAIWLEQKYKWASQYAAGEDVTAAAIVADNLTMALYFFALIFFAGNSWFRRHFRHPLIDKADRRLPPEWQFHRAGSSSWGRQCS